MKLLYRVESDRNVVVDGLGAIPAGVPITFTALDADAFKFVRGVSLLQTNVPEGVTVTIIVSKEN